MFKFTVLKYNKFVLTHLGILSKQLSSQTCIRNASSNYILWTMTAFVMASVIFVLRNTSQFDVALRTCAIAVGTSQSIGMYFCFGANIRKINALHLKLQEIIDKLANGKELLFLKKCAPQSMKIHSEFLFCSDDECVDQIDTNVSKVANSMYWTSELRYQKFSKKMFYYGCFQLSTFLTPLLQPILEICMGNVNVETWNLPFNAASPFDMRTISGWLLTWFFQVNVSFAYGLCMIIMTTEFVGSCHYMDSMCNHFELLINSMHADTEQQMWRNVQAKIQRAIKRQSDIYEYMFSKFYFNFSPFYYHLKLLNRTFQLVADINSGVIFFLLPANVLLLSMSMYIMEHVNLIFNHIELQRTKTKNCLPNFFSQTFNWLFLAWI